MAEQTQTTELASKPLTNTGGGLISNIGDTLDKIKFDEYEIKIDDAETSKRIKEIAKNQKKLKKT